MSEPATSPCERLWYSDPHLLEFTAQVTAAVRSPQGTRTLELDRTAFYATGGGQPHDTGTLLATHQDGATSRWLVVDVVAHDDGRIAHHVEPLAVDAASPPRDALPPPSSRVTGQVDAARRRDHLQQHTGQHLLSAALVRAAGIETKSFHLGAETSTIDVDPALDDGALERALDLANRIVFDDRATVTHHVTPDELPRFQIRRQTFSGERIRLVEVPGFDVSTCGGTHARRTGEVGLIVALSVEKAKGLKRIEFACGGRAARAFLEQRKALTEVARELSTAPRQAAAAVRALREAEKAARKRGQALFAASLPAAAAELAATATPSGAIRLVCARRDDLEFDEAQALARAASAGAGLVVALVIPDGEGAKLLLARSADLPLHAGELVKRLASRFELRGGGSAPQAQAALADRRSIEPLLAALAEECARGAP
jgi:alanyl-tRNA synthetase